jgi:hypothetical protein
MLLSGRVCTGLGKTLRSWLDQGCPHCPIFLTAAEHSSGDPYFSATVVGRSLKPTKHHRLGGPLPPPTIYYIIGSSAGGKLPFIFNYGHLTLPEGRFLFGTHPVAMKGNSPEERKEPPSTLPLAASQGPAGGDSAVGSFFWGHMAKNAT